ncbi:hypothetical protein DVH24_029529 [Malus domestica]|uniref:Ubiquitin-like protease family profile domain-containing protein n=1 Tax=Malus domestica TaxID=3750 RepID=A0A498HTB1_MALDO|nr:hypothetical protein DVH24_029529 [Malus domestica]
MHEYGNIKIMAPVKTIAMRRLQVAKCLPIPYAEKLKQFLDLNDDRVSMWNGEHCAVIRDDILALLNEGGVSRQVVDSFFEILNDDQIGIPKDQLKYGFMLTFAWGMHYTLLVFNKQSGWWEHYNTLQTKLNMYVDPYFEEAKKLHVKISDYFKHMKDSISRKLNENSICKHIIHDDIEFLMWLRQTNVEYPLKANISCSQQFPNIYDCGVVMMYIAQKKAEGELVKGVFSTRAMKNMRAHVLCKFINEGVGSWEKEE